jgi:ZIP family zinc transporter
MLTIILIAVATFISTLIGGFVALKLKDKLHLVLGFSAGAVIAVALFDLLPEAINLGKNYYEVSTITSVVALGFLVYLMLDRIVFLHTHEGLHEDVQNEQLDTSHEMHQKINQSRGVLGAGTLSIHSFLDGIAIGLAFQIGTAIGVIVSVAVLIHDFSDGVNTVSLILKNSGDRKKAFHWLFVDAIAPVVGVCATFFFTLPESALSMILAIFSGFFLYIGASDLIPESHHAHPKFLTTFMTILGAGILYTAIRLVNI